MPNDLAIRLSVAKAGLADTAAALTRVILPTMGKGPLRRRPRVKGVVDRFDLEAGAVRCLEGLRARHGDGLLVLAIPGKSQALALSPAAARRVLLGEPEPFTPASDEKQAALAHFEPKISLASRGEERALRTRFNAAVLEKDRPVHSLAAPLLAKAAEEAGRLAAGGAFDYDGFKSVFDALTRRLVLGDGAREDTELTEMLDTLRANANWAFLHPGRGRLLDRFIDRIEAHLARAEPGSLAAAVAATPKTERTAAAHQVAHYLFGWDGAGMTILRLLAVLATHPAALERARDEAARPSGERLPYLRAAVLDTLRLWPTTPLIFRQSTAATDWDDGTVLPEGSAVTIYVPGLHRACAVEAAHAFRPELWLGDGDANEDVPRPIRHGDTEAETLFVPFSLGGGRCPAGDLVPMVSAGFLAALLAARRPVLVSGEEISPARDLPVTLDHFRLGFRLEPWAS